jgi:thiamine biosynthesis lipoprotein
VPVCRLIPLCLGQRLLVFALAWESSVLAARRPSTTLQPATCKGPAAAHQEAPPAPQARQFEFSQVQMGTVFKIVLYAPDARTAECASGAAFDRIARLDAIMSDYNPASELMRLCERAGDPPVEISDDLFRVIEAAQDLARRSGGAFDITAGPIVHLWRRARRRHEMPDREQLAHALELVGYRFLRLEPTSHQAQLLQSGILLDLGGIAKGDAADQALLVLKRCGIESALVAAGGDIAVSASPPRQNGLQAQSTADVGTSGWKIAVSPLRPGGNPQEESRIENPVRYVLLHDCAISTSGDAEQHVDLGGVRYSHIVNPKTGLALTGRRSVTVVAPNGITADSLATAVSVLGRERGVALIKATASTGVLYVEQSGTAVHSFRWNFPE